MGKLPLVLLCAGLLFATTHRRHPVGVQSLSVTQANIHQTICVPGYSASVRPPLYYTERIKRQRMREEHLPGRLSDYELDHWWPIEDGGSPTDDRNLVMQPWKQAREKDAVENYVHLQICLGELLLKDVPYQMQHWRETYETMTGRKP